mgnify:CR=1 FL=1
MKLFVRFMVFVIGVQLLMSPSYAYISNEKTHNSDERLFQLALKRGLAVEKKDGSGNWLSMPVEGKLEVVKMIRAEFKAKGVLINNPPLYYVDQVNNVLYQSISENKLSVISDDTIRTIFQTIAVMEGDYDDGSGKSKIVQLRD